MLRRIKWQYIALIAIPVLLGNGLAYLKSREISAQLENKNTEIENLTGQLTTIRKSNSQLEVDLQTNQTVLEELSEQQRKQFNELSELRRELTFYKRIVAPEKVVEGVELEALTFTPEASDGYYYMNLVLIQVQKKKRHIKATATLSISGSLDGEPAKYLWNDIVDDKKQKLIFSFKYFQSFESSIKLPDGFVPERVELNVKVKGSRWYSGLKLHQKFDWGSVLQVNESIDS